MDNQKLQDAHKVIRGRINVTLMVLLTVFSAILNQEAHASCASALYELYHTTQAEKTFGKNSSNQTSEGQMRFSGAKLERTFIEINEKTYRYEDHPLSKGNDNISRVHLADGNQIVKIYDGKYKTSFLREIALTKIIQDLGFPIVPITAFDLKKLVIVKPYFAHEDYAEMLPLSTVRKSSELANLRRKLISDVITAVRANEKVAQQELKKYGLNFKEELWRMIGELSKGENVIFVPTSNSVQIMILDP
ncbi:MAG: hypothetical protein SGI74_11655 [Oligoflexia bacterium]|nr:hypothetical protein [Oligoflexia bacterium]